MDGEILQLPGRGTTVFLAHRPQSPVTSLVATYARGFGHDPAHAPGVAHLHEHLYLATLRTIVTAPMVASAQTHADTMNVSATVLAGHDGQLVTALAAVSPLLAAGRIDDDVRLRECRAIDVELSEWFGNPLLVAGHKLAALATRRHRLARFDECRIGGVSAIGAQDLRAHASRREANHPERLVIVGPRPAEAWLPLLADATGPPRAAPEPGTTEPADGHPGPRTDLAGADSRVYVGIPLHLDTAENAEAAHLAAQLLLHARGPLAEVGNRAGARFRGGSVVPAAGCAVVTGSWIVADARQREAIGIAFSQHRGNAAPALVAAQAAALPQRRSAAVAAPAALAAAIDAWRSGYGIDPTATGPPDPDGIDRFLRAGWDRAVLVGANSARNSPF
ncbi:insulinase family protein [Micromonospora sp. KLBMP9576]|uniref:insulinase family protein n=1 Tax=Micromonospora sp. KLBMP9576 TaxID=3424769 RepID=UPI003D90443A